MSSGLIKYRRKLPIGFRYIGEDIQFERPALNEGEAKGTVTQIMNACKDSIIDGNSAIYISQEALGKLLRTNSTNKIRKILSEVDESDKLDKERNIEEIDFIIMGEILKLINREIGEVKSDKKRLYLRISEKALINMRDSQKIRALLLENDRKYKSELKKLKGNRKKDYAIKSDELTGEKLKWGAEFSHIRAKSAYPNLALDLRNGLIVNRETHRIITKEKIENEDELLKLCIKMKWKTSWHEKFKNSFE
ncbi:MAG: hypothetical protein ACRDAU_13925 [Clostridium sp.]